MTLLFANFAEAIAEARGRAQADSLRKTRQETPARKISAIGKTDDAEIIIIPSSQLKKGDLVFCEAGDTIPSDGEIVEGIATIDESAITGESAPVIREAGGDKSSVTGGTKVLSDRITVIITTDQGESFLDKMIALVEGASRQKTPNALKPSPPTPHASCNWKAMALPKAATPISCCYKRATRWKPCA